MVANSVRTTTTQIQPGRIQLNIPDHRFIIRLGDMASVIIAGLLAYGIWQVTTAGGFNAADYISNLYLVVAAAAAWLLLASANDFYDPEVFLERTRMLRSLIIISMQMALIYLVVFFVLPPNTVPRLPVLYHGLFSFAAIGIWRVTSVEVLGRAVEARRVMIVGYDPCISRLMEYLEDGNRNKIYNIVGIISDQETGSINGLPVLGKASDLARLVERHGVSELVLAPNYSEDAGASEAVIEQYQRGVHFISMPHLFERLAGYIPVEYIGDSWASVLPTDVNSDYNRWHFVVAKRAMDIVLSLLGLIVFVLVFPFIALAIKLDSEGDIFYSQERVGLHGKTFRIYKLRTMVKNAEAITGPVFAQSHDPRVTRVGRFMRKSRLDELPQLYNVLRGDMSLIGPRPERMVHVNRLAEKIPFYRTRLVVRPGLTGWAQVRYGYGATDEDAQTKLEYDLYYIRNASVTLDLTIMMRTVYKVVALSGQ